MTIKKLIKALLLRIKFNTRKELNKRLRNINPNYNSDYNPDTYMIDSNGFMRLNQNFIKICKVLDVKAHPNIHMNKRDRIEFIDELLNKFMNELSKIYLSYKLPISFSEFIENSNVDLLYFYNYEDEHQSEYKYNVILNDKITKLIKNQDPIKLHYKYIIHKSKISRMTLDIYENIWNSIYEDSVERCIIATINEYNQAYYDIWNSIYDMEIKKHIILAFDEYTQNNEITYKLFKETINLNIINNVNYNTSEITITI